MRLVTTLQFPVVILARPYNDSASSMAAANNTIDETIALITAANTVVQDATSVGTGV